MAIFNINTIFFKILDQSPELREVYAGDVFVGESPENYDSENITINTINVRHGKPQTGTSNINIHVPDVLIEVDGVEQYVADENRINDIVSVVVSVLESAVVTEFGFKITNESTIENGHEHYVNLRLDWVTSGNNIMLENKYYTRDEVDELLKNYLSADVAERLESLIQTNTNNIGGIQNDISEMAEDVDARFVAQAGRIDKNAADITSNAGKIATNTANITKNANDISGLAELSHTQNTDTSLDGDAVVVLQESDVVQVNKKTLVVDELTANIVNAETIVKVHAEEATIKNNVIVVRGDSETAIPSGSYSGIIVKNYDGQKDMALMVDAAGIWSIGDVTQNDAGEIVVEDLRPLTTRTDIADGNLPVWNNSAMSISDSGIKASKIGTMESNISALQTTTATHTTDIANLQTNKMDKSAVWYGSLAEYNAMTSHDVNVRYYIEEV